MFLRAKPSRSLNHNRGLFGLEGPDFVGGGVFFVLVSVLLDETPYAVAALPLTLVALTCLVPLRMTTRRGTIRDWLSYFSTSRRVQIR